MKKFRINGSVPFVLLIFFIIGLLSFIWFYFDSTNEEKKNYFILLFIMMIILPLGLLVWSFITMWPCILFDEKGITKTFLGKKLKYISWKELYEIKIITTGNSRSNWVVFSLSSLEDYSYSKIVSRRDNIRIVATIEILYTIRLFAPKHIALPEYFKKLDN